MPKTTLTPRERNRLKIRIARARREQARVDAIVRRRLDNDIARMMRDNRAGGI